MVPVAQRLLCVVHPPRRTFPKTWNTKHFVVTTSAGLWWLLSSSSRAMSTPTPRRAAIAQLRSTSSKHSNLVHIAKCAGWAQREGCSMLFLPECFGFMGENSEQTLQQAEPPFSLGGGDDNDYNDNDNDQPTNDPRLSEILLATVQNAASAETTTLVPTNDNDDNNDDNNNDDVSEQKISILAGLQTIARASNLWISGGGMHVLVDDDSQPPKRVYNTHVILDNQGKVVSIYRKVHLFDVSIPGKVNLRESATTAPGTKLVVCDSPIGKLGLSTCYDVRFPEMYIPLVQNGAQILLVPSAFTVPTGSAHWHLLLRARAIESQCYVFAAAQYGQHNSKRQSYGHSLAIDPWGTVLADAGGCDGKPVTTNARDNPGNNDDDDDSIPTPSIITCDIDLEHQESIRQRMPIQQHRDHSSFSM